jgi:hypothetical protein
MSTKTKSEVPSAMQVQLSRLFGKDSKIASSNTRSNAEWKRDLKLVLVEIWNYLDANVETDIVHRLMLESGFSAAHLALTQEDFWPGYTEGVTRILLCLLGDYPDHRKRKRGSKKESHYKLNDNRSLTFIQSNNQKQHMLFWSAPALLNLRGQPINEIHEFRNEVGFEVPITEFMNWYKQKYPDDYLKVF